MSGPVSRLCPAWLSSSSSLLQSVLPGPGNLAWPGPRVRGSLSLVTRARHSHFFNILPERVSGPRCGPGQGSGRREMIPGRGNCNAFCDYSNITLIQQKRVFPNHSATKVNVMMFMRIFKHPFSAKTGKNCQKLEIKMMSGGG